MSGSPDSGAPVPCLLRAELEDFEVEELPLYPAAGEGEHLFVTIEKRGIDTGRAHACASDTDATIGARRSTTWFVVINDVCSRALQEHMWAESVTLWQSSLRARLLPAVPVYARPKSTTEVEWVGRAYCAT